MLFIFVTDVHFSKVITKLYTFRTQFIKSWLTNIFASRIIFLDHHNGYLFLLNASGRLFINL